MSKTCKTQTSVVELTGMLMLLACSNGREIELACNHLACKLIVSCLTVHVVRREQHHEWRQRNTKALLWYACAAQTAGLPGLGVLLTPWAVCNCTACMCWDSPVIWGKIVSA